MNYIYPVSFNDANNKVSIVVKGYRDRCEYMCSKMVIPKDCLALLNKTIVLIGFYAGVNTALLFRAKVESSIVNGEIDAALVSSACNFPCNSIMIVRKDYGAPSGLIHGFVNAIMNGSQTGLKIENSNERDELEMLSDNI